MTSSLKDFTRGGQMTMHSIRMFGQATRYLLILSLCLFLGLLLFFSSVKTTEYDRYVLSEYLEAYIKRMIHDDKVLHSIKTPQGQVATIPVGQFLKHRNTAGSIKRCFQGLSTALWLSLFCSFLTLLSAIYFFKIRGKSQQETEKVRGNSFAEPKQLTKLLKAANKASDIQLAGVPLLKHSEVQHILLTGTTGSGKSVCIQELMDQVRAKQQRAIVYDIEGTLIPMYYRPGKDVILNPLDVRCPNWNLWQECEDPADFEAVASSLMPLHLAGSDPFWIHSARTIFASAALKLHVEHKRYNRALLEPLFTENLGGLANLLKGSVAESLVSEKNEKTALSIKATLSTYCKALMYLKDDTQDPLFSIRRWVTGDKGDGWLFIASNALKIDALKPLMSVWIDVAVKSLLSLSPSQNRRLWFFMDELPSLHRLPSLMNALSRGRKYGGCFVGSIQDIHQLCTIYGRDEAETLTSLFNTNLCYRTKNPDSAAWMSKMMGRREIIEKKEGYSYGANDMRDGVSIHQERRRDAVVMDAEFLELDDLNAFLRLPGDWPVTKLIFDVRNRKETQPSLISREIENVLLMEQSVSEPEVETETKSEAQPTLKRIKKKSEDNTC